VPEDPDNFTRFRTVVLGEPVLEQRLQDLDDWDAFSNEAIAAATRRGIELTTDELETARRQEQLRWLARWA
jgi:hypothetical protein